MKKSGSFKKILCVAMICCVFLTGSAYAASNYQTIDGIKIYKNITKVKINNEYVEQVNDLLKEKFQQKDYKQTLKISDYYIKLVEKARGLNSTDAAYAYITKANTDVVLGNYDSAKKSYDKAFSIAALYPDDEKLNADVFQAKYFFYTLINDDTARIKLLDSIDFSAFDDNTRLDNYIKYSNVYMDNGYFDKAKEYLKLYHDASSKTFGDYNPNTLRYYIDSMYLLQAKFDDHYRDIESYYKKAVDVYEIVCPEDLNEYSRVALNAVNYYKNMAFFDEAFDKLKQLETKVGNNQGYLNGLYGAYYYVYSDAKDYDNAFKYLTKLNNNISKFGGTFQDKYYLYDKYYHYYYDIEQFDKALQSAMKMLELTNTNKNYAPDYQGEALQRVFKAYAKLGNAEKTEEYYAKSLQAYKINNSEYKMRYLYSDYGKSLTFLGNNEKALEYFEKALDINDRYNGKYNAESAGNLSNIANIYLKLGDKNKAISSIDRAYKIAKAIYGKDNVHAYEYLLNKYNTYSKAKPLCAGIIFKMLVNAQEKGLIEGKSVEYNYNANLRIAYKYLEDGKIELAKKYADIAKNNATFPSQKKEIAGVISLIESK